MGEVIYLKEFSYLNKKLDKRIEKNREERLDEIILNLINGLKEHGYELEQIRLKEYVK
jgi:DNA-binding transcriptional regulator YhcF (GntR family)